MNKNLILIGKALKTHGVKGNLSAVFYSKNVFSEYKNFFDRNGRELELKIISKPVESKENDLINSNFKTIININKTENCNDAMKFVNFEIFIQKSQIQKNEDEFLISDLIGMEVFDFNDRKKSLGFINDVHDFGGGSIIEINFDKKYTEFKSFTMLPFDDKTFPEITKNAIYLNFSPKDILNVAENDDDEELNDEEIALLTKEFEKYMEKSK